MATDVVMPRLSDSMEEGTVLTWLVEQGGEVKRGEPLAEIETDKANMTYEADTDGTLIEIVASEGETLAIGEVIARIGEAGEAPSGNGAASTGDEDESGEVAEEDASPAETGDEESASEEGGEAEAAGDSSETATEGESEPQAGDGQSGGQQPSSGKEQSENGAQDDAGERIKASPVARRMAREMGVEIGQLTGSGPGGRVVKADVESAEGGSATEDGGAQDGTGAAEAGADDAAPEGAADESTERPSKSGSSQTRSTGAVGEPGPKGEVTRTELTRLQQTVARRMAESKATAPDFQLQVEIDMASCVELRARLKQVADPAPSLNDMIVKACAIALREAPRVNGAYKDGEFEHYSQVNVGIAVAGQDALVVPTIFGAGTKSLGEIARSARELAGKVKEGTITPPELSGGTFTVSNLGMFGIDSFSAIINPPQAALLAVGAVKMRPVVEDSGRIVARETMTATLVADHRILYGADAAEFLARVRELLEQPLSLAL